MIIIEFALVWGVGRVWIQRQAWKQSRRDGGARVSSEGAAGQEHGHCRWQMADGRWRVADGQI